MRRTDLIHEARATTWLAMPIAAGQVSQMLMGFADTLMVGRVGVLPLAASAFANSVWSVLMVFGMGLLSSVPVQVSHERGSGRVAQCGAVLRSGLLVSLVAGLVMAAGLTLGRDLLRHFGQTPEVVAEAMPFFLLIGWSIVPALLSHSLKQFSEALNRPWPPMIILFASVGLNVWLNWVLIYGNWGAPALGLSGAGWATLIARVAALVGQLAYVAWEPAFRAARPFTRQAADYFDAHFSKVLLHLGMPVGLQYLSEVSAFASAAIMMGWIGAEALAAHQIAITCAATTFMIPLGLSSAASMRVSHAVGAAQGGRVRAIAAGALVVASLVMGVFAILFLAAGNPIARLFVADAEVVRVAAGMLVVAGFFQLFDGAQVVLMGSLRGLRDVRVPAWISFGSYWAIGLATGYVLAFVLGRGPIGMWVGLAIGLACSAAFLSVRFVRLSAALGSSA
jgi:MATE family multidrug resistance protein